MAKVLIGCRLPHGLKLHHPNPDVHETVTLAGYHSNKLVTREGRPAQLFATTQVDADFWAAWKTAYSSYKPLRDGKIFEATNEQQAALKAKEMEKDKTGFEGMTPEKWGVTKAEQKD